ncbi:MAG: hypothetical protein IPN17_33220 [Deltaproteobacteria bacterium]|nr:hypothetical protein [Deltaproteobacteria bacterium]
MDAAADLEIPELGAPPAHGAECPEEAGGDAQAGLESVADVRHGGDGDQQQAADHGADQIAGGDVDDEGDEP